VFVKLWINALKSVNMFLLCVFYFILFILFYFILFYFILFYFILQLALFAPT